MTHGEPESTGPGAAAAGTDVAILFADICDSTPLYEESGDALALAIIAGRLDDLAGIAGARGGRVIRSKGDDVLCTFEDPAAALDAAAAMVTAHGQGTAAIRVGIHCGPVIGARSDIFGDAVNVAARMLALAKPGEAVVSEAVVGRLGAADHQRLALLGRRAIKGKVEPIELYSLILDDGDTTQMAWSAGGGSESDHLATVTLEATLELEHAGRTVRVGHGERCLLGRADRCDLIVDSRSVSREHASIEVHGARVTITDQSSTGTWVLGGDGAYTTLRRDSGPLYGEGLIRLGRHPNDPQPAAEIAFRVSYGG